MKTASLVLLITATALGTLSLAGPADNSLVVGAAKEPLVLGDFWSFVGGGVVGREVEKYLWAGLEYVDIEGNDQPYLATEAPSLANGRVKVKTLKNGEKRVSIHYTLRPDARWSDGEPITSDDVAFYYQVGKYPGAPVRDASYWKRVSLKTEGPRDFTVTFQPGYFYDLKGSAIGLAPRHVMYAAWRQAKAQLAGLDPQKDADKTAEIFRRFVLRFATPSALSRGSLVYSGPFVIKDWRAGERLWMARNPRFFITPPGGSDKYVQKVTYRFISDPNALLVALLGGELDASASLALSFDEARAPQLTKRSRDALDVWMVPSLVWEHLEVNKFRNVAAVRRLRLDDPRTRQALLYAIDRKGLVDAVFDGLQALADDWVCPAKLDDGAAVHYSYQPQKARRILASLGWRDADGDGYLERTDAQGQNIDFELEYVVTEGGVRDAVQSFIAKDLAKVGIRVKVRRVPAKTSFSKSFFAGAYQGSWRGLFQFAWLLDADDLGGVFVYKDYLTQQSNTPTPANGFAGVNFGWRSDEYDKLRARAMLEFDDRKRRGYLQRMRQIWLQQLPALPLYWRSNPLVVKKGLVNFVSSAYFGGMGYPSSNAWLIGWAERGAQQMFYQGRYAFSATSGR